MTSQFESSDEAGHMGGHSIGGLSYTIGFFLGVLILVIIFTYAAYFCTRSNPPPSYASSITAHRGLDESTIIAYPKFLYADFDKLGAAVSGCSICLADYKATDMVRLLPDCGHLFHQKCVDQWLRLHPSCPICRSSPMPTPLETPLAAVVPLSTTSLLII